MMPRILLHAGMGKAGSTALQRYCATHRPQLEQNGVLYPDLGNNNHEALAIALFDSQILPRSYRQQYANDWPGLYGRFESACEALADQIQAKQPQTVLLSSEYCFFNIRHGHLNRLLEKLRPLSSTIEVILYIRRPSSFYLSFAQQSLRASPVLPGYEAARLRTYIEQWSDAFGASCHVVPYEPAQFPHGSIVHDFFARFLTGMPVAETSSPVNVTMSAEAMAVLQEYQRRWFRGHDDQLTYGKLALIGLLHHADRHDRGTARPRLLPGVAGSIDREVGDLEWLQTHFGLSFGSNEAEAARPSLPTPVDVADICVIDEPRKKRLERFIRSPLPLSLWKQRVKVLGNVASIALGRG